MHIWGLSTTWAHLPGAGLKQLQLKRGHNLKENPTLCHEVSEIRVTFLLFRFYRTMKTAELRSEPSSPGCRAV
jgi:hypothetical protein